MWKQAERFGWAGGARPAPLFLTLSPGPTPRVPVPMLQIWPKPLPSAEEPRGLRRLLRRLLAR